MCAFATAIQFVLQEALQNVEKGIKVNGTWINNIRYADDTVLIADNMCDLQGLVNVVGEHSKGMGLKINANKTKYMIRQPDILRNVGLTSNGSSIERMNQFKYLAH